MVSLVVMAALLVGVTVAGLKEQVAEVGRPEQAKVTAVLKPFWGVTVRVRFYCCCLGICKTNKLDQPPSNA